MDPRSRFKNGSLFNLSFPKGYLRIEDLETAHFLFHRVRAGFIGCTSPYMMDQALLNMNQKGKSSNNTQINRSVTSHCPNFGVFEASDAMAASGICYCTSGY